MKRRILLTLLCLLLICDAVFCAAMIRSSDTPYFAEQEPSAENISRYIFDSLKSLLPAGVCMKGVEVFETEKNSVLYQEDA